MRYYLADRKTYGLVVMVIADPFSAERQIKGDPPALERKVRAHRLQHEVRHSPDGFEWGYSGSGPSDLARSLLFDHMVYETDVLAGSSGRIVEDNYMAFRDAIVAKLPKDGWAIATSQIESWLEVHSLAGELAS
jgi:hypothetical protein